MTIILLIKFVRFVQDQFLRHMRGVVLSLFETTTLLTLQWMHEVFQRLAPHSSPTVHLHSFYNLIDNLNIV